MPEPIMHIPAVVKRDDAFNNGGQTQVGKNAAKSAEELEAEAARRKQREADRKDREAKRANAKRCFCLPPKKKKAEGKGRQQMRFPLVCKRWTMFGMLAWCVMLSWQEQSKNKARTNPEQPLPYPRDHAHPQDSGYPERHQQQHHHAQPPPDRERRHPIVALRQRL